jgi:hypothetical protein
MLNCNRLASGMRVGRSLFTLVLAAICALNLPGVASASTATGMHCTVEYSGVLVNYATALAAIYDCAWDGYLAVFGIELPKNVVISVTTGAAQTRLWNDGARRIHLDLASDRDLQPDSGYFFIYGICQQAGMLAMYSKVDNVASLADGVGPGWAHYCGSLVLDYVYSKLGQNAWPAPYDYSWQGEARLKKDCGAAEKDATMAAACAFYAIGKQYRHLTVGRAMRSALSREPKGADLIAIFAKAIDTLTKGKASAMIPDAVRKGRVAHETPPVIPNGYSVPTHLFEYDGGWVGYDDDSADGMRSIAGDGHAVQFHLKHGGTLKSIKLKASRYGNPQTDSQFTIYIMNEQYRTIEKVSAPYMTYEQRGEDLYWREFKLKVIKVPKDFIVLFSFNPTQTDGIYVGFDKNARGHSFTALADEPAQAFTDGDWMVRVKVE